MDDELELGTFGVRGHQLTTVAIGKSLWCCFVEICTKLLPFVKRTSIHNRVNRSKARMVLADKSVVAALKRNDVLTKHTGKVYLVSLESVALVLSLFENDSKEQDQESGEEDEDGGEGDVNPGDDCTEICKMEDDGNIGAEEIVPEAGNHETVDDGEGDDNSDEEDATDGKFEEESSQDISASVNAPVPGPGRGRRRCPECSNIVKSNQPTCNECGKRLFTPGRKRRGGLPGMCKVCVKMLPL